jgi:phosphomannomutase/phosphoglucomutase
MKKNIFREYDIRGLIGSELKVEETYELAKAIITYLKEKHPNLTNIVIGRDGRTHSQPIQQNIVKAITDLGFDVIDVGVVPSPVVYYAIQHFKLSTGLVVTASHNPKEYNGIKIWGAWGQQIQKVREILENQSFYQNSSNKKGTVTEFNIIDLYLDYMCKHFAHIKNASIKAVIDCGNGAAGTIVPKLIKQLNLNNVKLLFEEVDGTFPNHEADPTLPENMEFVKQELRNNPTFEVGLGLDGDCDRMDPMTKQGELVPGDKLLAIYAQQMLKQFPKATVIFDIKSSSGPIDFLKQLNANPQISPSGHSLIKQAMAKHKALLAGELSCHFFFNDRYFGYDDGIYATLRLFELLIETKQTLEQLLEAIPHRVSSPEFRVKCANDAAKIEIVETVKSIFSKRIDAELLTIDGIKAQMPYGWGLVRASNTQPVICLRFESKTEAGLLQIKNDFFLALKTHFDENFLRNQIDL